VDLTYDLLDEYGQAFVFDILNPLSPDPAFRTDNAGFEIGRSNIDPYVTVLAAG
jgi:hypothetical protein